MSDAKPQKKKSPATARILVGTLIALMSLSALVWTITIFTAEYQFRIIQAPADKKNGRQFLTEYALKVERLLKLDPSNGEIRNMYASTLGKLGDYNLAVKNLELARKTNNDQDSLYFLADMYEKLGNLTKAEATMAECLIINPFDRTFNPARLRLLNSRLIIMENLKHKSKGVGEKDYQEARRAYGEATLNWAIRAPNDRNAYLFLGQFYVKPLYPLQAYRSYLIGLSSASWLNLTSQYMILPQSALGTVGQIINGHYAKPYRNLP